MSKRFLVAVDGSNHAWKAADVACDLARACGAELLMVHVVPKEPLPEGLKAFAAMERNPINEETAHYRLQKELGDEIIKEAEERVQKNGIEWVTSRVVEGHPTREIAKTAKRENVDMIFVGSRGFGEIAGLVMGSVSQKVMHLVECPCVIVK